MKLFRDRHDAGLSLARQLAEFAHRNDVVVLGLPRGGVPVAYEVAAALDAPLDVLVVRKLGAPQNEELAFGAVASDGIRAVDRRTILQLGINEHQVERILARETRELQRRDRLYRGSRPFPNLTGRTVIIVDDGLATGATMRVAVEAVRARHPAQVIAAAPVGSFAACEMVGSAADRCVCAAVPEPFYGVGVWYDDFSETTDSEVIALLERAAAMTPVATTAV